MTDPTPAHHQRAQAHMTIQKVLAKMRRDDNDLAARAAQERPDGYPEGGGSGGGGGGGHSDPTGRCVERRQGRELPDGSFKQGDATRAIALTMQAAALLAQADSLRAKALPPRVEPKDDADWCTNCEKAKELSPRGDVKAVGGESTLCTWCHAFHREHGMLPPRVLVRKHARGERIYTRDIVAALQALQPEKAHA